MAELDETALAELRARMTNLHGGMVDLREDLKAWVNEIAALRDILDLASLPVCNPTSEIVLPPFDGSEIIGANPGREDFLAAHGVDRALNGGPQGAWAKGTDPQPSVWSPNWPLGSQNVVLTPGNFWSIKMDPAFENIDAGTNSLQAALKYSEPVLDAEIVSGILFIDTPTFRWQWGISGKLLGLAAHHSGQFPGGGNGGIDNFSVRLIWTGERLGMYVYGQSDDQAIIPGQIAENPVSAGWRRQTIFDETKLMEAFDWGNVRPQYNQVHEVAVRVRKADDNGWFDVMARVNGVEMFNFPCRLLGTPPYEITHSQVTPAHGFDPGTGPDHTVAMRFYDTFTQRHDV